MGARRLGAVVLAAVLCAVPGSGSATPLVSRAQVFTGYGFDTCAAPSLATLDAWSASPYRAVGIYLGGVNRACPDGNLSASWVAAAVTAGWALGAALRRPAGPVHLPGRPRPHRPGGAQAPRAPPRPTTRPPAPPRSLSRPEARSRSTSRATPSTTRPARGPCRRSCPAWADRLRALGYVAGVYGSAASTMRDLVRSPRLRAGRSRRGLDRALERSAWRVRRLRTSRTRSGPTISACTSSPAAIPRPTAA